MTSAKTMSESRRLEQDKVALNEHRAQELGHCYADPLYFVNSYCRIYDSVTTSWIPFHLWNAQLQSLRLVHDNQLIIILKARQIGLTWLCLSYALWTLLFRPIASIGIFSRRDADAIYLLGYDRLRGIFKQLPDWMKSGHEARVDSGHEWILENGSSIRAFPTSAGDSYVSTLALVDEADLVPNLNQLMRAVKPTIDNGGKLILLSRSDKSAPQSEFKQIYRASKRGQNGWSNIFLPWNVHPRRDQAWYDRQRVDIYSRTGSLDDLYEQYPLTDTEALSPRSLDKRISPIWIEACFQELQPVRDDEAPAIPGLEIYFPALPGRKYVIGADPAEGNPTSDDSAMTIMDYRSGEEVACLAGKFEPAIFGTHIITLSNYYNGAAVLVERNNHGHAVIQWIREFYMGRVELLKGHDGKRGWLSSLLGKTLMYTEGADHFRLNALGSVKILHSYATYSQLASIEGSSLSAPDGMNDDRADSYVLALMARVAIAKLPPADARRSVSSLNF